MNSVKEDFEKRKREIEEYFDFLLLLDDIENSTISYHSTRQNISKQTRLSNELQKIIIANSFLLLYNLIEATIRNSIKEIFSVIRSSNITYGELSDKLKKIWIGRSINNLQGNYTSKTLHETLTRVTNTDYNKK